MPGAFDYSKWDNIDTSSSDDEQDAPSSADSMQALHDYAFSHGMDEELRPANNHASRAAANNHSVARRRKRIW